MELTLLETLQLRPADAVIVLCGVVVYRLLHRSIVNAPRTERAQNGISVKLRSIEDDIREIKQKLDDHDDDQKSLVDKIHQLDVQIAKRGMS